MPLEVRDLGAAQEDVLAGTSGRLLLLDLNLHDVRGVLDDLGDVGAVTGADLTKDTLVDPDNTTNKPVALFGCQIHHAAVLTLIITHPENTNGVE